VSGPDLQATVLRRAWACDHTKLSSNDQWRQFPLTDVSGEGVKKALALRDTSAVEAAACLVAHVSDFSSAIAV